MVQQATQTNTPNCTILDSWVFENFMSSEEPFAEGLRILEACLLVNNDLFWKLVSSLKLRSTFDVTFKVTQVPFLFLNWFYWVGIDNFASKVIHLVILYQSKINSILFWQVLAKIVFDLNLLLPSYEILWNLVGSQLCNHPQISFKYFIFLNFVIFYILHMLSYVHIFYFFWLIREALNIDQKVVFFYFSFQRKNHMYLARCALSSNDRTESLIAPWKLGLIK